MGISLLLFALLSIFSHCSAQWCYQTQYSCDDRCKDPSRWSEQFPSCGGDRQSPINIVTSRVQTNSSLAPFHFHAYNGTFNISAENMGHSVHFDLPGKVQVSGGGLPDRYQAVQFHLHWGMEGGLGSEHTIDGERYPMELHIVHVKEIYASLEEAAHDPSGVVVLAFLFEESSNDQPHINTLIEALGKVRQNGTSSLVTGFRLSDIIPCAKTLHSYYRYVGSMTTPGCDQAVVWTLFHQTLLISHSQLVSVAQQCQFWTGQSMHGIFRPVQRLNGRTVYRSSASLAVPRLSSTGLCVLCVLGALGVLY
ncbi:carbonic anhydrase IV c [Osmerus mordax]|uniref:carbonic anhydrase IV c n=1 Tax=Osmerus mordax TaxID=8014 RepID=UPI00350EDDA7